MSNFFYSAFLIVLLSPSVASACSWGPSTLKSLNSLFASMVTSENNKFLLKMLPSSWKQKGKKYFKVKESIGTVYKLGQKGNFQYLWNAKNISPYEVKAYLPRSEYFTVLLSNDGKRVVKVKEHHILSRNKKDVLIRKDFLVIYEQGKVSRRYSYFDVFKKVPSPILWSCPGGYWVSDIKLKGNVLSLKSGSSSSKNAKEWNVDIVSGKTAK